MNETNYNLARDMAPRFDLDADIVCAMVTVESFGNNWATRYEPKYKYIELPLSKWCEPLSTSSDTELQCQKMSWGLLQVMGGVARQYGFCGHLANLCDPVTGLSYALKHLRSKFDTYKDERDSVAAYNAGSVSKNKDGTYTNQEYVDKVFKRVEYLRSLNGKGN